MTEQEWLSCTDPEPMLAFLKSEASHRKLRLFAVACLRRILDLLDDYQERVRTNKEFALKSNEPDLARNAVEVAERFADGRTEMAELKALFPSPDEDDDASMYASGPNAAWTAKATAYRARWIANCCSLASYPLGAKCLSPSKPDHDREQAAQCFLLRDIFSNPFRSIAIGSSWLTPKVVALVQKIYDDRAFDRLPNLADALEEAGCPDVDILAHCRGLELHVRGCWVVDAALGKE
jgi:hypothetical protein